MERLSPKDVDRMLQHHLRGRPDLGFWKLVGAKMFEPRNPFDALARPRPQRWFVILLIISSAAVVAFVYFNLWN